MVSVVSSLALTNEVTSMDMDGGNRIAPVIDFDDSGAVDFLISVAAMLRMREASCSIS